MSCLVVIQLFVLSLVLCIDLGILSKCWNWLYAVNRFVSSVLISVIVAVCTMI